MTSATQALADESPEASPGQEVVLPAGTEIVNGEPGGTEPPDASAPPSGGPTSVCLGGVATYGSQACFQHYGDTTWVADTEKDGRSAAVAVYTDYGRAEFVCINYYGANTWATCKKDYWEKGNVRLLVLRYDYETKKFYQPENTSQWVPVDGQ
ncbi:hypothetical protein [Streptomyces drozdowiczii]|uniref:hypothetical protein n=1 Tax=Streptomyces drozdowiczii TaxID=202862 RepID=UPI00403C073E